MKNKVCFILGEFPSITETFVTNQIVQTHKAGYEVSLLSHHIYPQNITFHNAIVQTLSLKKFDYKIPNNYLLRFVLGIYLSVKNFNYALNCFSYNSLKTFFTTVFKIEFFKRYRNINTFHVQFGHYGLDIALMKKIGLIEGKLIVTFHGYDAHYNNTQDRQNLANTYQNLFTYADNITVNTSYLYNKLKELNCPEDKMNIIPMGIDLNLFKPQLRQPLDKTQEVKLISVGRLIELKGHEFAIKAIKKLVDTGYTICYNIIGDGQLKGRLQELIIELELEPYVFLLGSKSQAKIKAQLLDSHIFLMPSITDITLRAETQGVVTAEAQAMNLPVVAFDSGGVKYTLQHNKTGFLVKEKAIEEFSNAIENLINNNDLYLKFSKNSSEFIKQHFDISKTSKKFMKLYNN